MDLFKPIVKDEEQNPLFKALLSPTMWAERDCLNSWAAGFQDRDNKFIQEFQTTFESSFWELYLNKVLFDLEITLNYNFHAPDFLCSHKKSSFTIEATISNPKQGGEKAYGYLQPLEEGHLSDKFIQNSILRIANSIVSKARKFKSSYKKLEHTQKKPFILAINSFDQPHSHKIGNRAALAVLYGIYLNDARKKVTTIDTITKDNGAEIPLGFFKNSEYEDISAIIFNPLANWGKMRALSKSSEYNSNIEVFSARINPATDEFTVDKKLKSEYEESIFDGLYVFHNPFAKYPLDPIIFKHPDIQQLSINKCGDIISIGQIAQKFLSLRTIISFNDIPIHFSPK